MPFDRFLAHAQGVLTGARVCVAEIEVQDLKPADQADGFGWISGAKSFRTMEALEKLPCELVEP